MQAVIEGNIALVKDLLKQGANVNAQSYCAYKTGKTCLPKTALGFAGENGHMDLVILLIQRGADVNARWGSAYTALKLASQKGYVKIITCVLDNGAKSHREDALSSAIDHSQVAVVKLLLERGANANSKYFWTKYSLLMKAVRISNTDIVKLLLKYGASVFTKTVHGETAYDYASTDEIREILKEAENNAGFFEKLANKIKNWIWFI